MIAGKGRIPVGCRISIPKQEGSGRMRTAWRGHSMGSELLGFDVLSFNRIQHQPRSAATWTHPRIIPLSPRTHYTRTCGHQLMSPPCRVRGPLQFSSGPPPLTWHSKSPSPGSLTPNTHTDISINGVQSCCDDESLFQVPSDIPISLRRPHPSTSVRVLISVVGMD